jgi:hypothetical protein
VTARLSKDSKVARFLRIRAGSNGAMDEPRIHRFAGGWAVSSDDFATFASTREEALRQFQLHESRTCRASGCADNALVMLEGVGLCLTHDNNVTSRAGADNIEDVPPPKRSRTQGSSRR